MSTVAYPDAPAPAPTPAPGRPNLNTRSGPGGVIEGTFSFVVVPQGTDGPPLMLTGKFRVCHGFDTWIV